MKYSELVRKITKITGANPEESQDALGVVVEKIASHLNGYERRGFAAKLPRELKYAASVEPTIEMLDEDMVDQLMDLHDVDESQARRSIRAAWNVITEIFDPESIEDIKAELPRNMIMALR